jgi:hypothetical protein
MTITVLVFTLLWVPVIIGLKAHQWMMLERRQAGLKSKTNFSTILAMTTLLAMVMMLVLTRDRLEESAVGHQRRPPKQKEKMQLICAA